jgi:hypothetical protein
LLFCDDLLAARHLGGRLLTSNLVRRRLPDRFARRG